jgi:hypothetical protein
MKGRLLTDVMGTTTSWCLKLATSSKSTTIMPIRLQRLAAVLTGARAVSEGSIANEIRKGTMTSTWTL